MYILQVSKLKYSDISLNAQNQHLASDRYKIQIQTIWP
jgi:hypothetical protein